MHHPAPDTALIHIGIIKAHLLMPRSEGSEASIQVYDHEILFTSVGVSEDHVLPPETST